MMGTRSGISWQCGRNRVGLELSCRLVCSRVDNEYGALLAVISRLVGKPTRRVGRRVSTDVK